MQFLLAGFGEFLEFILFDGLLCVTSPVCHSLVEDGHAAPADCPLGPVLRFVFFVGIINCFPDGFYHARLDFEQPLIDVSFGGICINDRDESNVLTFGTVHTLYFLIIVDAELMYSLETLL